MLSCKCLKGSKIGRRLQLVTSTPQQNALDCIESFSWPPKCNQLHHRKNEKLNFLQIFFSALLLLPLIDFDYLHFLEFCRRSLPQPLPVLKWFILFLFFAVVPWPLFFDFLKCSLTPPWSEEEFIDRKKFAAGCFSYENHHRKFSLLAAAPEKLPPSLNCSTNSNKFSLRLISLHY